MFGKFSKALDKSTAKRVDATRGRDSKYSSKVYVYTLDALDDESESESELDRWFGKLDAVERDRYYDLSN